VCGIGISSEMVHKAIRDNCGIIVNITKYGVYRINPNKLERLKGNLFKAHDGKYLYEYPLIEFDRVEKSKEEIKEKEIKELKRYLQTPLW
jgi:DNA replication protein DnaD